MAGEGEEGIRARVSPREQFDRQAAHYDRQWNDWNRESLEWITARLGDYPSPVVLDIATGGGFTAFGCAPVAGQVVGLDVSPGMLAQAGRRASELGLTNVRFVEGPAERIPFPDGFFDVVTCRIAAHHFDSVPDFLRETRRVLGPGGALLLADTTVPDGDAEAAAWQNGVEWLRDPSHARNLSPSGWRDAVQHAGLEVREVDATGGGITIPLEDWLRKAGCAGERAAQVRVLFESAPASAVRAFGIQCDAGGAFHFTWQRVLLHARRPG